MMMAVMLMIDRAVVMIIAKVKKKLLFPVSMTAVATMITLAVAISSQMMTVSIISSIVIFLLLVTMTLVIVTVKMRWKPGQTKTCRQMMSCFPVTVSSYN